MATFFHLRPNKYIDRLQFVMQLQKFGHQFNYKDNYKYVGFGSYSFDDFQLIHKMLGVNRLISLERDANDYQRAYFNNPLMFIEVINTDSTSFISDILAKDDDTKNYIIWYDFMSVEDIREQIDDFCKTLEYLVHGDIIRISMNATPSTLHSGVNETGDRLTDEEIQLKRLEKLESLLVEEPLIGSLKPSDLTTKTYPLTLLRILESNINRTIAEKPFTLIPTDSTIYKDGSQMLTATGLIWENEEEETLINMRELTTSKDSTGEWSWSWKAPRKLNIPDLTVRETLAINKLLPTSVENIESEFPFFSHDQIKQYISYYKLYPHFHSVNF